MNFSFGLSVSRLLSSQTALLFWKRTILLAEIRYELNS